MSTTIDQRVVEMRFDNRQFENNVQTSISTLEKLKQKLNLTGASKGLENLDSAARKVNMGALGTAVDAVNAKFSALQVMGVTTLANITNSAVNAGKRIASALTIDPIKTGLQEYETQINAVQTILANTSSKGSTLQDVNTALDELNTYADKTIYNFTEMTRNIGTFTAAGVGLNDSVSAIKGIANLAAVSGSSSQQASNAMYQLSQALAAGKVSLMDWNSVVNAGMGGQVFQDALKQTAKSMGIAVNESISFRESISSTGGQESWLTSEVLLKTLEQFTMAAEEGSKEWERYKKSLMDDGYTEAQATEILKMANTATDAATKVKTFTQLIDTMKESVQSGWTQSWEIIIGDFGEAKEFLTKISDTAGAMIGAAADARNEMLSGGLSTGWKQLLNEGIADEQGYIESIKNVAKEHGVSIDEIIEKEKELTGKEISFTDALKKGLSDGSITSDMLSTSVTKLADSMRNMTAEERAAAGYTDEHLNSIEKLEEGLKKGTVSMDEFVEKINRPSGRENLIEALWNSFDGLMSIIKPISEAFREIFPRTTGEQLYDLTVKIRDLTAKFKLSEDQTKFLKSTFKGLFSVVDIGVTLLKNLASGAIRIISSLSGMGTGILGVTGSLGDWLSNLRDSIKEGNLFGRGIDKIVDVITNAITKIKEFGISVKESFSRPGYDGFSGFLKSIWELIKNISSKTVEALSNIGQSIADVFGENSFSDLLSSGIFAGLIASLYKFVNNMGSPLEALSDLVEGLTGDDGFLNGIKETLDGVKDCFKAYQNQLNAQALIKIAGGIAILAGSLWLIASIKQDALERSLGAITVLFVEMIAALSILGKIGKDVKGVLKIAIAMSSLSSALLVLSIALKIMSTMSLSEMCVGLVSMAGGLTILIGAINLLPEKNVIKAAKAIGKLSSALLIFSIAMKILATMSWDDIARGLTASALGLGILVAAVNLLPKDMALRTLGMVGLATSMVILGGALKVLGSISWNEMKVGLIGLTGALAAIAVTMRIMPKNMIGMGLGLIGISTAIVILSNALQSMGSMSMESLVKSLAAMGIALLELSIALKLMNGTLAGSAALLVAAGALAIITPVLTTLGDMSWTSIIKGLTTLAGTFIIMGVAGYALSGAVVPILALAGAFALFGVSAIALGAGITLIATGFSALSTSLAIGATSIVASITVIIAGILDLIPTIMGKFGDIIIAFCKLIGDCAPEIADTLLKLISEVMKSLATYTPKIADSLFEFVIGLLDVIADRIPELIAVAVKLIGNFFQGVVDALGGLDSTNLIKGIAGVGLLSGLMIALSAVAGLIPGAMVGVLGMGVVIAELAIVLAAVGALAQIPGLSWLISEGGNFLEVIGTAIGKFIGGIAGGIASGFSSSLPGIGDNMSSFMMNIQPFIEGAKTIDPSVMDGVKTLVGAILAITAANVMDSIASFITGKSSISDFASQLTPFGEAIVDFSRTVSGKVDDDAITAAANAGKILAEMAKTLPNSGGLAGIFAGNNDISDFSEQIVTFGEMIVKFSKIVANNIDNSAIEAAANAGKIMSEMANTLPNTGGVSGFFVGNNDMSTFGDELVSFGRAITQFSTTVKGKIDKDAVESAANAGKLLAEMAAALPKSGGFASLFVADNDISTFAAQLTPFGNAIARFSSEVKGKVDKDAVESAANAGKVLAEMAAVLPKSGGFMSVFSGDSDISTFAAQITPFGNAIARFSSAVAGKVDKDAVEAAANSGKLIAEMAAALPKSGGFASLFTADNDISTFAAQLTPFGNAIARFSSTVNGKVDESAVASATNAGRMISEMVNVLPKSGGFASLFTADNDISTFANEIVPFGNAISRFSNAVKGNIDESAVASAANAGRMISEMAAALPTSGGFASVFSADNDISTFANEIEPFGTAIARFSSAVKGQVDDSAVESAANAGKILAEMARSLTSNGGFASVFTADNDISTFAHEIVPFGNAIASFSSAVAGKVSEDAVTSAANAGKILAEMATSLPSSGGFMSFFSADNDISTFANEIGPFGDAIASFSSAVAGKVNEEAVVAAANAGRVLAEMAATLPMTGGVVSWFTGDNDMGTFGTQLVTFGNSIANFSSTVMGKVNEEAVIAAANSGKVLAGMAASLPDSGGFMSWFSADNDMSTFAEQLIPFGRAIANFSTIVTGNVSEEGVTAAAKAGQMIGQMASSLPATGGIMSWFNGDTDMSAFGRQLVPFGRAMKNYSLAVSGINEEAVTDSANAAKSLASLANNLPTTGGFMSIFSGDNGLDDFAKKITPFGTAIKNYSLAVAGINVGAIENSVSAGRKLLNFINSLSGLKGGGAELFKRSIETLGRTSFSGFIKAFTDSTSQLSKVGSDMISSITNGIKSRQSTLTTTSSNITTIILKQIDSKKTSFNASGIALMNQLVNGISKSSSKLVSAITAILNAACLSIRGHYTSFYNAGGYLVTGFANGISANSYQASAKAAAMATAAKNAAEKALKIKSPSRVFYAIGDFAGQGFVNALGDYSSKTFMAGYDMADSARSGLGAAISRIKDVISGKIDSQPTIRPVLDLSGVYSGASALSSMLDVNPSVGIMANVRSISSAMGKGQNGGNDDVISAIKDLKGSLGKLSGNTYNIDGITYDNDSSIASAIEQIVSAATRERRA